MILSIEQIIAQGQKRVPNKKENSVKSMVVAITIIKSSGRREKFLLEKLAESLTRSGAPPEVALDIARQVERQISPTSHTKAIFRLAKRMLRKHNAASGMKYSLKSALSALGPSGYPFEKYVARILKVYGYDVEVDKILGGYCVNHEVDVYGRKGNEHCVIECKYHSNGGNPTDVKIALYVHARFEDIRKAFVAKLDKEVLLRGWLVTNTRCTADAIKYAECAGLKIVSWRYPEKGSLEKLIEEKRLYPVTVLPSARKKELESLFRNNIILAQEIADMDERTFLKKSGLDSESALIIKKEADAICPSI